MDSPIIYLSLSKVPLQKLKFSIYTKNGKSARLLRLPPSIFGWMLNPLTLAIAKMAKAPTNLIIVTRLLCIVWLVIGTELGFMPLKFFESFFFQR